MDVERMLTDGSSETGSLDLLTTESVDETHVDIDLLPTNVLVAEMNRADLEVADAVGRATPAIAAAVDAISARMRRGGRLIYLGAGTPGRLGILDASECPPTFGTEPGRVIGVIAGGEQAVFRAIEGAEDDVASAAEDLNRLELTKLDSVVGISASGRTVYVVNGIRHAGQRGALTVGIACNQGSPLGSESNIAIEVVVGPEFLTGSTRLKAGTAQKMVLNMLSTLVMVRLGKTYGNLMVDARASNKKLRRRAERMVMRIASVDEQVAHRLLVQADWSVKVAVISAETGFDADDAKAMLNGHDGNLRRTLDAEGGRRARIN